MAGSDGRHHRPILKWGGAGFATRIVRGEGNVVAVLALLAAVQAAVIGKRMLDDHARHDEIEVGDDLSEVSLWRADRSLVGLGGGRTTLLLVYDPDCAHSDRVAAGWREWLERGDYGANQVFALHVGSRSLAEAYSVRQRWPIEVVSGESGVEGSGVQALTRRTPWVFAIDEDGLVVIGLGSPSGGGYTFTVLPESYRSLFAPSANGSGFVVVHRETAGSAEPHTFRVIRFDAKADTAWARDIPYTRIPVSSEWRSRNLGEHGDGLEAPLVRALDRAYRKLQFFPPVGAARAGADGTTWLLVRTGVDSSEWEVLDPSGRSVARVEPPQRGRLRWASTDGLWFLEHDELDIPYLVQYAIRRP